MVVAAPAERGEVELPLAGAGRAPRLEEAAVRGEDQEPVVVAVRHPDGAVRGDGEVGGVPERVGRIAAGFPQELDRAGGRRGIVGEGAAEPTAEAQRGTNDDGTPHDGATAETGHRERGSVSCRSSVRHAQPAASSDLPPNGGVEMACAATLRRCFAVAS